MVSKVLLLVFVGLVVGICKGTPIIKVSQNENSGVQVQEKASVSTNCIPTIWGCLDLTDPALRPRITRQEGNTDENVVQSESELIVVPCIRTVWGCIDISDPSFLPRYIELERPPVKAIPIA